MSRKSTAFVTVDFENPGKQSGFIHIPHSPHEDAWGTTRIPIAVVKNGDGPTAIIQGGNHGDEYEGPIVLGEMARELDPTRVQGRVILLPAINIAAVEAGRRTSPVDGLNMNRTFPGDPAGSITQQTSAFVNDVIFPLGDAFLDLHSGGSSLDILPSGIIEPAPDPEHHKRNAAAVLAFDAPLTVVVDNLGERRTSTAASVAAGLTTVGTEMGGGGTVSLEALKICRRGAQNVLSHLGILERSETQPERTEGRDRPVLTIPGPPGYVFASANGVFEGYHPLGTEVRAGQEAGRVHHLGDPFRPPETLRYGANGILYGRRQPGRVVTGNCCLVVATPYEGELP
ncbi:succinylglutamate desuccinylase/aspartoacylase family protein [Psychromarinibacter sp. C21-152]|uniref:Succinylglutamate desuccinylase/aspartoacylase family protein n=1 Tax=Psychromarinibacter sediminicola TaxID=3033385 RepID=A0AAE3TAJ1_9RHOB|nr:succinylglutamate desuccinylase/aspartoacylase family protein [Psychromarinibacter sediminicola]MDF0603307.1 succinylglutamate desuccinylase/aspartoacylase family protein [Psychromarinibacter sediminicola]